MLSGVIERVTDSTRKHICRRQESELGRSIGVFMGDKGTFLVVPESVLLKDVVLENQSKSTDVNTIIDQTSTLIRSAIQQDMTPTPTHISISNHLERFLVGIISEHPDNKNQSQRVTTLV